MPRQAERACLLKLHQRLVDGRLERLKLDALFDVPRGRDEDDLGALSVPRLSWLKSNRRLSRGKCRKTNHECLHDVAHDPIKVKDNKLLNHYRATRESFACVVELIKDHPAFQSKGKRKQAPPECQLLVLLKRLGSNGNGANAISLASHFGAGAGAAHDC